MQYQYPSYSGFRCVACNIAFNNFDDQKQHYFAFHSRAINSTPSAPTQVMVPFKTKAKSNVKKTKTNIVDIKCDVCNISCSSTVVYDLHIKGKKHAKALQKTTLLLKGNKQENESVLNDNNVHAISPIVTQTQVIYTADIVCQDCCITCSTMDQLEKHISGAKHIKVLRMKKYKEMMDQRDPSVYCKFCDMFLMPELMKMHCEGGKHKRKCNDNSPNEPVGKKRKANPVTTTVDHCGYCALNMSSAHEAIEHYQSQKHAANAIKIKNISKVRCELCDIYFDNDNMLDIHSKGFKHYVKANKGNTNPEGEMSGKLLRMREKIKGLKVKRIIEYQNKLKNVSGEGMVAVDNETVSEECVDTKTEEGASATTTELSEVIGNV